MSLQARIETLATRIAQEFNTTNGKIGNLAGLSTTAKANLVAAINEVAAAVASGALIDDQNVATTTTYSSDKIVTLLNALKAEILGGADAAYDTLLELQQAIQADQSGLTALTTAVANRVRFDAAQTLTTAEQAQACANIGVGDPETNFVAVFEAALV
jgi:hypothetical protein